MKWTHRGNLKNHQPLSVLDAARPRGGWRSVHEDSCVCVCVCVLYGFPLTEIQCIKSLAGVSYSTSNTIAIKTIACLVRMGYCYFYAIRGYLGTKSLRHSNGTRDLIKFYPPNLVLYFYMLLPETYSSNFTHRILNRVSSIQVLKPTEIKKYFLHKKVLFGFSRFQYPYTWNLNLV